MGNRRRFATLLALAWAMNAEAFLPQKFLRPSQNTMNSPIKAVDVAEDRMGVELDSSQVTEKPSFPVEEGIVNATVEEIMPDEVLKQVELAAQKAVDEMMEELEEECEVDFKTGGPKDDLCVDEEKKEGVRQSLKKIVSKTLRLVRGSGSTKPEEESEDVPEGELLERGWEKRANSSALARNAEIWVRFRHGFVGTA